MLETNGLDTIPVPAKDADARLIFSLYFSMAVGIIAPLVAIGVLTGFHPGQSTKPERVWTMIWFVFGVTFGPIIAVIAGEEFSRMPITMLGSFLVYGVGAIGGLVTVGKMLKEYGDCIRLG